MAENKTARTGASVEDFLAAAEPAGRREDGFALKTMLDDLTGAPAEMWGPSMVGYGAFEYSYASGHGGQMMVLGFAPRKASMSLYGLNIPENQELLAQLGLAKVGAGCVWVGRLAGLDHDVLAKLFRRAWDQRSWTHPLGHVFTRIE